MTRPRAILFDLGDTLLHFAGVNRLAVFLEGARAGHAYLVENGLRLGPVDQFLGALVSRGRKGIVLNRVSRREIDIRRMFILATGVAEAELPPRLWEQFVIRMYQPLAERARLDPDARPVLERLADAGIRMAIASNTFVPGNAMENHLEQLGIRDLFGHRFYSSDVGYKKPSLTLFRLATEALGVSADETWHVGDEVVADILGARRAGMTAVLRLHGGKRVRWWWPIKPHRTIRTLGDLLDLAGLDRPAGLSATER